MKSFLLLFLVGISLAANLPVRNGEKCKSSLECGAGQCCRDSNGRAIIPLEGGDLSPFGQEHSGTCSRVLGKKGEKCGSTCGCEKGYTCYRPMSGVCCQPSRCYDSKWVKEQELKWKNCFPPKCFFPV